MASGRQHKIDQCVFDVSFDSEENAFAMQSSLDSFLKNTCFKVIDEVFNDHSTEAEVVKIDRLEIDLGTVEYNDFRHVLPIRLRSELDRVLREKIHGIRTAPMNKERIISRTRSEVEQLIFFLATGILPWFSEARDPHTLRKIFHQLSAANRRELVDFLRRSASRPTVIRRFVAQFPQEARIEVLRLLRPRQAELLLRFMSELHDAFTRCEITHIDGEELLLFLWCGLFTALLQPDGNAMPWSKLCQDAVGSVAQSRGLEYGHMLRLLQKNAGGTSYLMEQLEAAAEAEKMPNVFSGNRAKDAEYVKALQKRLTETFLYGDSQDLRNEWPDLLRNFPDPIREVIRQVGKKAQVRKRIAYEFDEAMIGDVVFLLAPQERSFIEDLIHHPETFKAAQETHHTEAKELKSQLWELTLTYLLVDRGTQFNRKTYTESLVRGMAAHENLAYGQLLASLTLVLTESAIPSPLKKELLQIFGELNQASAVPETPARRETEALIRAYDGYEALKHFLLYGGWPTSAGAAGRPDNPDRLLDELAREHPQLLQRLFRQMQTGEIPLARATHHLSARQLDRLIAAVLSLSPDFGRQEGRSLLRAIKTAAAGAKDIKRYYAWILARLSAGRQIDVAELEELAQGKSAGRSAETRARGSDEPDQPAKNEELEENTRHARKNLPELSTLIKLWNVFQSPHGPKELFELLDHYPQLSEQELSRLVGALLFLKYGPAATGPAELFRTIERRGKSAKNIRQYYGWILDRLSTGRAIDFAEAGQSFKINQRRIKNRLAVLFQKQLPAAFASKDKPPATAAAPLTPSNSGSERGKDRTDNGWSAVDSRERLLEQLAAFLQISDKKRIDKSLGLQRTMELMLRKNPARLKYFLLELPDDPTDLAAVVALLPEGLLVRLLLLLRPEGYARRQMLADRLTAACGLLPGAGSLEQLHLLKWRFLFRWTLNAGPADEQTFLADFVAELARAAGQRDEQIFRALLAEKLEGGFTPAADQLHREILRELAQAAPKAVRKKTIDETPRPFLPAAAAVEEPSEIIEDIYIANAGLVLAGPYLPSLFERLKLTAKAAFLDRPAAERGVHLLQFMANQSTSSPEYQLVLNKILCGVRTGIPIQREIDITDEEKATIEGLIRGMIQNWQTLGSTSVAGFRESFLQREGRLQRKDDAWHLLVEQRPFDMLLDRLPWSFSTIKYPWMERVLYVDWR